MARSFAQLPGYEIITRIGKGAGAVIYQARARTSREIVAVKHVVRHGPDDDRFLAQAELEHEVASKFDSPYLRKCLELVRIRRWLKTAELFLIMEYFEGETLENRLATDRKKVTIPDLVDIFVRVAEGLLALHRVGYAHADIKPNNVLLNESGQIKIIDFGQSCPLGHRKERVQGTPDYMAPEQVLRHPIDQRTDVFNLGATMYWVLTGKWFRTLMSSAPAATKKIELESRVGNDPPHIVNPDIPLPLSQLVSDCCEMEPSSRPREMSVVLSRLDMVKMLLKKRQAT